MKWPNRSRSDGATAVEGDSEPEVQLRRTPHQMRSEESKRRESFESETTEILDDDEESVHISTSPEPSPVVLNRKRLMTPPSMGIHGGYVNSFVSDDSDAGTPRNAAELFAIAKSTSQKHTTELLAEFRSSQSKNTLSNRSGVATGEWVAIRTSLVIAPSNKRASESIRQVYPAKRPEITYQGWDRGFNIKPFDEREMEAKHGSLQLTRRPWLDEYDSNARGYPWTDPPSDGTVAIYLYHPAFIYGRLPDERECEMYYIDLFFQYQFYASKSRSREPRSPDPLLQAWKNFLLEYASNPVNYKTKLELECAKFLKNSSTGLAMKIHQLSIASGFNCTMPHERCQFYPVLHKVVYFF